MSKSPTKEQREQRDETRIYVDLKVSVEADELLDKIWFDTNELSENGMFLVSDLLFDRGTELKLGLNLPGEAGFCETTGKIVWINTNDETRHEEKPPGMGLQFVNPSEDFKKKLFYFLNHYK